MTFAEITASLAQGFGTSCVIFFLTLVLALPLGLIITFGTTSKLKLISAITKCFVWVIRGTPLMLQIFVVFYVPSLLWGAGIESRTTACVIAFVINYACYFSEIYRGGIESISHGQYEAGEVLGMTKGQIFIYVALPQVIKRIIPAMGNEIITLVKDTSLARVIGVVELISSSYKILSTKALVWPLFYAGAFYLIFNGVLTVLFRKLEDRLSYYKS